jgi:hypothetical protein
MCGWRSSARWSMASPRFHILRTHLPSPSFTTMVPNHSFLPLGQEPPARSSLVLDSHTELPGFIGYLRLQSLPRSRRAAPQRSSLNVEWEGRFLQQMVMILIRYQVSLYLITSQMSNSIYLRGFKWVDSSSLPERDQLQQY